MLQPVVLSKSEGTYVRSYGDTKSPTGIVIDKGYSLLLSGVVNVFPSMILTETRSTQLAILMTHRVL